MDLMKELVKKKKTKIVFFLILDAISLIITSILAIWLRFDFGEVPNNYWENAIKFIPVDFIIMVVTFFHFRLYTSVWKYASVDEALKIVQGCIITEIIAFLYKNIFKILMPRSYFLIQLFLITIFVGGTRFSFRILRRLIMNYESKDNENSVMIIGAGDAGKLLIDEMIRNQKDFKSKVVCVIDDNKEKKGTYINGKIPIVRNKKNNKEKC